MFNSSVIDVGIGLIFVFLILALMCTSVNEWLAQFFKMRAATLEAGIQKLLPGLATDFFNHALVKPLAQGNDKPSYVPARTFAVALIDLLEKRVTQPTGGQAEAGAEGANTAVP